MTARPGYILIFVKAILAVYIIDTVLVEFGRAIYVPLIMTVAQSFITNIATAVLLLVAPAQALCRRRPARCAP